MDSQSQSWLEKENLNRAFWCLVYGGGVIATLLVYGLLQEKLMTVPFGGELFVVSAFLVLCNRCANIAYAGSMIAVLGESFENKAPIWKYMIISLSNVAATTCQYEALKYVSFPVQMLGKSFKMLPVMLWGMAISGKRHSLTDWLVAGAVTMGVTEFCMTGPTASPNDKGNSIYGMLLLVMFLACDGLTSTFQEKLFKEHNTSKYNQMFYINGGSAITSLVTVLAMGKMSYCLEFALAHGDFVYSVAILSGAAASSQFFIYSQVKEYGALAFAATMNVRQVVSILLSYRAYHHVLTLAQGCGLMIIFTALFYKSYAAMQTPAKPKGKDMGENEPLLENRQGSDQKATV